MRIMSLSAIRRAMACAVLAVGVAPLVVGGTAALRGFQPRPLGKLEQSQPLEQRPDQSQPLAQRAATMRTLLALDTNQDGKVDMGEIEAFAKSQGLDAEASTAEFSGLDTDGDGVLSQSEITAALGNDSSSQTSSEVSVLVPEDPAGVAPVPLPAYTVPTVQTPMMQMPQQASLARQTFGALQQGGQGAMAQDGAAATIVKQLKLGQTAESEAQQMERKSADLLENARALARETAQQALDAANIASTNKANELVKKAQELLEQASIAEVQAAEARALAQEAGIRASAFMEVADGALAGASS